MYPPPKHNIKVETWTRSASYPSAVSPTLYEASGRNLLMEKIQERSLKRISTWSEQGSSTSAACRTRQCRGWQLLARPQNYLPNLDLVSIIVISTLYKIAKKKPKSKRSPPFISSTRFQSVHPVDQWFRFSMMSFVYSWPRSHEPRRT